MLTIRFLRQGKKHQPFFKIVVVEKHRSPKSGKFVEEIGFYNPITKERRINKERVLYWIKTGADVSDSVYNLLITEKIISGPKRVAHSTKKKKEESQAEKEEVTKEESKEEEKPSEKSEESKEQKENEAGQEKKENINNNNS
ncbi:30S ribosomal protein S16 [bacterium]|nr:30S ribosomal protein S16 [bacterium]